MTTTTRRPGVTFKDALTQVPPNPRFYCAMTNAMGNRCTGEALDPDPVAIQICLRHAGEVLELINQRSRTRR